MISLSKGPVVLLNKGVDLHSIINVSLWATFYISLHVHFTTCKKMIGTRVAPMPVWLPDANKNKLHDLPIYYMYYLKHE